MTLLGTDLILVLMALVIGFAVSYVLLLSRVKAMITERQLRIADQLGALDDAIRALETRLREHQLIGTPSASEALERTLVHAEDVGEQEIEETGEIASEIQAAIAAATAAALGPDAIVQSVKPALSPWSQQGRVMVQGGHNLRVRR